jgi:lysophospholipase L1-like esterase
VKTRDDRQLTRQWVDLITALLGVILGFSILYAAYGGQETAFEELGLGGETSAVFLEYDQAPIHCRDIRDAADCVASRQKRGNHRAMLWLGASQLHGVNYYETGDKTAPWHLHDRFSPRGLDVITFSQPNANAQEHLILFEYLRERLEIDYLLVAAVLDDMREGGIRTTVAEALGDRETRSRLDAAPIGRVLVERFASLARPESDELAGLDETTQRFVEASITNWLTANSELWRTRKEARGQIAILQTRARTATVRARNFIAGISAIRDRVRMNDVRYQSNAAAIEAILESAQSAGIETLVYIQPRAVDAPFPYDPDLYVRFKGEIEELANRHGGTFLNIEDAVVGPIWGEVTALGNETKQDIFHFKAEGHTQLANALEPAIHKMLEGGEK